MERSIPWGCKLFHATKATLSWTDFSRVKGADRGWSHTFSDSSFPCLYKFKAYSLWSLLRLTSMALITSPPGPSIGKSITCECFVNSRRPNLRSPIITSFVLCLNSTPHSSLNRVTEIQVRCRRWLPFGPPKWAQKRGPYPDNDESSPVYEWSLRQRFCGGTMGYQSAFRRRERAGAILWSIDRGNIPAKAR